MSEEDRIPELGISETLRDELRKRDWSKPSTKPDNPDTFTSRECAEKKFSGFRINPLTLDVELWIVGRVLSTRRLRTIQQNPGELGSMIEESCATNGSLIEADVTGSKPLKGKGAKQHGR